MPDNHIVRVKVWGEYACWTRPELKVERMSYPIMTPSGARGVLDAILFKKKTDPETGQLVPAFNWHVRRIIVLRPWWVNPRPTAPYHFASVRRNEIADKIPVAGGDGVNAWMKEPTKGQAYLVDSMDRDDVQGAHRSQRNTLLLRNVAYLIEASVNLVQYSETDPPVKYREMFERRVQKGQCFHRPYLGCREFAADFAPPDGSEELFDDWNESLGLMLYDIRYGAGGRNLPGFFHAEVRKGVLHCDTADPGPGGEPPVNVLGWEDQG